MRRAISTAAGWAAFLLIAPAHAGQPGSGAGLSVRVKTRVVEMVLKPGKKIPVTIEVRDSGGVGVENLEIRLDATRGVFGELKEKGGGIYRATYRLPKKRHPMAVVLAAKVAGAPPGWTVLKLRTPVNLPVETTKPRVLVTLDLGGRSYGPFRSNARGRVEIPIEVGPGETEAQAVGVDEFGNRRKRTVRIPIPPAPRLAGFAERTTLAADGQDSTLIYLVAIEPDGSPAENLKVAAIRKGGKLSPSRRLRPGLFWLRYTAPDRLDRSRIILILAAKPDAEISRRKFVFELTAGQPARLTLAASPEKLFADGKSGARLTMAVGDSANNPLQGRVPSVHCSRGTTKAVRELGGGRYEARYIAPIGTPGSITCRASLAVPGGAKLTAETDLTLLPPLPGSLEVSTSKPTLPMDGRSTARIDIVVLDKAGNPLAGVQVQARAGIGSLDPVSEDGHGHYHASYTAPPGTESTRVRLEVVAGQGRRAVREQILISLQGIEPPPPPSPWVSIGPSAALLTNFGRLLYGGFLMEAAVKVPGLGDFFYVSLESGYRYGRSTDGTGVDGRSVRTDLEYAPLHLSVLVKPAPHSVFTPVLGIGGGLEFVQWSIRGPGGIVERGHQMLLGSLVTVGGEVRLGSGALVLYVRYLYAYLSDRAGVAQSGEDRGGSIVKGSVGGMDVSLGYRLHF